MRIRLLHLPLLFLLVAVSLQAADPLTVRDYVAMPSISSPSISPDGKRVAYVVSTADFDGSAYDTDIWLADMSGGHRPFRLARSPKSDHSPAWSPDGQRIAFLSDRDGTTQLWLIRPDGGDAWKLTSAERSVGDFRWSPSGEEIAYTTAPPDPKDEAKKKSKDDAFVVGANPTRNHLFILELKSGKIRDIAGGEYSVAGFDWSPDGKSLVIVESPDIGAQSWFETDLYLIGRDGGDPRPLVVRPGIDAHPRFSPDGGRIAFVTGGGRNEWNQPAELDVVSLSGGSPRVASRKYERNVQDFQWSSDGTQLFFQGALDTTGQLFSVSADGASFRQWSAVEGVISDANFDTARNRAAFVYESLNEPPELFVSDLLRFEPRRLTDLNDAYRGRLLGETRLIRWKNPNDGQTIEGLLTLPVGYEKGKRYPLLTFVHGGPASHFDQRFLGYLGFIYPPQVFAAKGFAVVRPNPRGTGSYPLAFRQANQADWGGEDYVDIQSGIDSLIEEGIADPQKLGIMGWSYGGFMSAWTITRTNRFAAASIGAPVVDLFSFHGTSDISGFTPTYFGGLPYGNRELYADHSPMTFIARAKTPALIQHGTADDRVPLSQGEMLYRALKELEVPAIMVEYPRSAHVPREPLLRLDVGRRNVWWFEKWLRGVDDGFEEYWRKQTEQARR